MDENKAQEEIYSQVVRAGKRTYFFDVRATRADDYYLTITESKKFFNEDGSSHYKKHKIFLYKEDFAKFKDAFAEAIRFIEDKKGSYVPEERTEETSITTKEKKSTNDFTDISFDDI
tara:strand:- start:3506 stop:3856 length:351 start_codon:yes stop_codon:yes gene_type:complete